VAGDSRAQDFRLSRIETEYMRCSFGITIYEEGYASLEGSVVPWKDIFLVFRINAIERWVY
jgi:hypothetical protein